ncbi:hypothetical protein DSECCO2_640130 [anaerobic digester metagenome]
MVKVAKIGIKLAGSATPKMSTLGTANENIPAKKPAIVPYSRFPILEAIITVKMICINTKIVFANLNPTIYHKNAKTV